MHSRHPPVQPNEAAYLVVLHRDCEQDQSLRLMK
jgi:hypothetical protein